MACPGVPDGGDDLQIWRVSESYRIISRGQSTRDGPTAGVGLTTPHRKKHTHTHRASDLNGFFGKENQMDRACSTHGVKTYAYRILVGKPGGKIPLGSPDVGGGNIKMGLR
jgi:hypothetical protein